MSQIRHDVLDGVTLAAVIGEDKQLYAIYAQPDDARPYLHDIYRATVTHYAAGQHAYFLDLDGTHKGLLPKRGTMSLQEGQKIIVSIERPATLDKQARCGLVGEDVTLFPKDGLVERGANPLARAQKDYPEITQIEDGLADFDQAILELAQPHVTLENGISLIIEQTAALTAIDLNSAGNKLKPYEVNYRAATAIARQLQLRNIGGQVVIDFLKLNDKKQQADLDSYWRRLTRNDN
ncbi:MAG TPA: ribonuclease E/G, partial [Alphaproteobacteria bacterium]